MAQASSSARTRTLFLLHGEDSFRIRLRANELVHSLLAHEAAPKADLSGRGFTSFGSALGLTRVDGREDLVRKLADLLGQIDIATHVAAIARRWGS